MVLDPIEMVKQVLHGPLVGFLGTGHAAFVNPIVDRIVGPNVGLVNLRAQFWWIQIDLGGTILFGKQIVEFGIEHSDDLTALVADGCFRLLVPQQWDSKAARVVRDGGEVDIPDMLGIGMQRVRGDVFVRILFVALCKVPSYEEAI